VYLGAKRRYINTLPFLFLYMYKKFTFAILSPDEFLVFTICTMYSTVHAFAIRVHSVGGSTLMLGCYPPGLLLPVKVNRRW